MLTGASKGIGYELSHLLDKEGANLFLVGRNFGSERLDNRHTYICADLTTQEGISALKAKVQGHSIDVLINMAGIGIYKPLEELTLEEFYLSQQLNLLVPFLLIKTVLSDLKQSDIGLVVNIGSGAGTMPFKNRSAYCASKFALRGLSLSLSEEFNERKPSFCLITLGSTKTTFGGKTIEEQDRKTANGEAVFPVEWVAKRLIGIIKDSKRAPEIVLYPGDEVFGVWKKP